LSFPDVSFDDVIALAPDLSGLTGEIRDQIARDALYANYINRQQRDVEKLRKDEAYVIPNGFDYRDIPGLSSELTAKLERTCPSDLAQAARIDGMTPAALALLLGRIRYLEKKSA
jgi:tRNA uridine 5-carboxymethylaminomethyl modification enzyme